MIFRLYTWAEYYRTLQANIDGLSIEQILHDLVFLSTLIVVDFPSFENCDPEAIQSKYPIVT
jgi:hypothetical protein